MLLDTLKPTDTVAIVVYAGAAGEVLPPTAIKDKETILQALIRSSRVAPLQVQRESNWRMHWQNGTSARTE